MMRFTMYVWQRLKEGKNSMILRPKIDSVREVVSERKFKEFFFMAIILT